MGYRELMDLATTFTHFINLEVSYLSAHISLQIQKLSDMPYINLVLLLFFSR